MGTRERRQRDVADREQRFLDTAQDLIQRDGLLNLQMARIAEATDYAIGTLYQHFASKEDLLVALATRNHLGRQALFERAARWKGPTRERMIAIALADLMLMREQPEHFRLEQFVWSDVVWRAASADSRARALAAGEPCCALVDGIVEEALACGDLPPGFALPPIALGIGPWSLCLGMHALVQVEGLIDETRFGEPYRLLLKHLQYLLNGYGWQPLADAGDDIALAALVDRVCRAVFGGDCPLTPSDLFKTPGPSHG